MKKTEMLPEDLLFIRDKYNIAKISEFFQEKYKQVEPETKTQKEFTVNDLSHAEFLTRNETFNRYTIDERLLFLVYTELEKLAIESGIDIEYVDMRGFSEDTLYENYKDEADHQKHAETARSDGKKLQLEIHIENAGGIQGRIYDLMHLAFGHMVQWSSTDPVLLLTREEAWSIGYRNHETSPDMVINMMSLYELEAGMQGIEMLCKVLDGMSIAPNQKERIVQYFVDYVYCDKSYILQHYRGNHESFQSFWRFGNPIPTRQQSPKVEEFIKRHAVEIGLIQDVEKTPHLQSAYNLE